MIIPPGVVLLDTAVDHVGYLDFQPPYNTPAQYALSPAGRKWRWEVFFFDSQGDGTFDDIFVRAWHRVAGHAGEPPNNPIPGHGYLKVAARDLGPQTTVAMHVPHHDFLTSAIAKSGTGAKVRRLWIRLGHSTGGLDLPPSPILVEGPGLLKGIF